MANAGSDTTVNVGDSILLVATGGVYYSWAPATYLSDTLNDSTWVVPTAEDTIIYTVIVTDSNGCINSDSIVVIADSLVVPIMNSENRTTNYFIVYPNPNNGEADIKFGLPVSANILINLYSIFGEKFSVIAQKYYPAGDNTIHLSTKELNLSQGVYYLEMQTGKVRTYQKIVVTK